MGDHYIKKEDGNDVVYEKDVFGIEHRIGEVHNGHAGSIWTGNYVEVDPPEVFESDRRGEAGGQKGTFSQHFLDSHPTFYPDSEGESSSSVGSSGSGRASRSSGSSSYSSGRDYEGSIVDHINGQSSSGLGWLVLGATAALFLGIAFAAINPKNESQPSRQAYYERIRPQNSRAVQSRINPSRNEVAKPDRSGLLEPGPPISGDPEAKYDVYYTFDITEASKPQRVMRITYSGSFLRRERTYAIDREKYPEVYRNLDINEDGETSMQEFMQHGIIFTNQRISEGVKKGDLDALVDKILGVTYGLCFTDTHIYYTLDCPVDTK